MECPHCKETLLMTTREGVEIDYCPKCRGIWLDRGELDKIIEKSNKQDELNYSQENYNQKDDYKYKDEDYKYKKHPYKKRKSFLSDLFDFD